MTHTAPTPAQHLATVARHWPDLRAALTTTHTDTWPPAGRLTDYLNALDDADREQLLAEHRTERLERNTDALGERPVPVRLAVLDTMRTVQAALVELADQIAAAVQRPPISSPPAGRGWTDELHRTVSLLAAQDAADTRRWRYTGERTAVQAAEWLRARLERAPGPFRPLTAAHDRLIAAVAEEAARRVEAALGMGRTSRTLDRPCPRDGGVLTLHTGGTDPRTGKPEQPVVDCAKCGWDWTGHELYELLRRLDPAA